MLNLRSATTTVALLACTALAVPSFAQSWKDPSTWPDVHPVETDNIVFRNVPLIHNPAANPDPGTPRGSRAPLPNTAPPGTEDLHRDI